MDANKLPMKKTVVIAKPNPAKLNQPNNLTTIIYTPYYLKYINLIVHFGFVFSFFSSACCFFFLKTMTVWRYSNVSRTKQVYKLTTLCLINWYSGAYHQNNFVCAIHFDQNLIDIVMKYNQRTRFDSHKFGSNFHVKA